MSKNVSGKNIYKFQIDIETGCFGISFAKTIKGKAGIESLTTGKGGVKERETEN